MVIGLGGQSLGCAGCKEGFRDAVLMDLFGCFGTVRQVKKGDAELILRMRGDDAIDFSVQCRIDSCHGRAGGR